MILAWRLRFNWTHHHFQVASSLLLIGYFDYLACTSYAKRGNLSLMICYSLAKTIAALLLLQCMINKILKINSYFSLYRSKKKQNDKKRLRIHFLNLYSALGGDFDIRAQ